HHPMSTLPDYLYSGNAAFLEGLYEDYLTDPNQVEPTWRAYFDSLLNGVSPETEARHTEVREALTQVSVKPGPQPVQANGNGVFLEHQAKQVAVLQLINAYRFRGHRQAMLDPLDQTPRPPAPDLSLDFHGLSAADLDTVF